MKQKKSTSEIWRKKIKKRERVRFVLPFSHWFAPFYLTRQNNTLFKFSLTIFSSLILARITDEVYEQTLHLTDLRGPIPQIPTYKKSLVSQTRSKTRSQTRYMNKHCMPMYFGGRGNTVLRTVPFSCHILPIFYRSTTSGEN